MSDCVTDLDGVPLSSTITTYLSPASQRSTTAALQLTTVFNYSHCYWYLMSKYWYWYWYWYWYLRLEYCYWYLMSKYWYCYWYLRLEYCYW